MRRRWPWIPAICLLLSSPARAQEKFSLSMFHFNIQYVAGGLQGFPSGNDNNPAFDLDDEAVQDRIVTESIEPVLDLLLAHPGWKLTLEMQAYALEVMQARHTAVLDKLVRLAGAGQVELVSFHWSDQLFLAYPRLDLERSFEQMDAVWQQVGLLPSPVVFCQEGQFGTGMAGFARTHSRSILVLPKNLFRYQHADHYEVAAGLYELDGVDIVLGGRSFASPEVELSWSFFDDGELLATDGRDPYLGTEFIHVPAAVAAYEQALEQAESEGFRIATIGEYVAWAKQNLPQPELPPVLDGTWQPPSTDSMHRWMGASGLLDFVYHGEQDNAVLTGNVRARHWIEVAEVLLDHAIEQGWVETGSYESDLEQCWRDVLLAQVSDASGINPFVGEVQYGLTHAQQAEQRAGAIVGELAAKASAPFLRIDTASGNVADSDDLPGEISTPIDPVFSAEDGFAVDAPGRETSVSWKQAGQDGSLVVVDIQASTASGEQRTLSVDFPLQLEGFYLTPGLEQDRAVWWPFSDFDFQEGRITLPLANGLLGIDDGLWLIKHTASVHIGATFEIGSGRVRFVDQTVPADSEILWRFYLLRADEQAALEHAIRLNLHPLAWVETGAGSGRGCGCGTGPSAGGLGLLLGLLMAFFRSRQKARFSS
ncbi:MAG: hypothetical protein JXR96_15290 [Deltaproteobacteria bacterium]|nr:hypothetical protein [Deltaproteobacteria bacterium]